MIVFYSALNIKKMIINNTSSVYLDFLDTLITSYDLLNKTSTLYNYVITNYNLTIKIHICLRQSLSLKNKRVHFNRHYS